MGRTCCQKLGWQPCSFLQQKGARRHAPNGCPADKGPPSSSSKRSCLCDAINHQSRQTHPTTQPIPSPAAISWTRHSPPAHQRRHASRLRGLLRLLSRRPICMANCVARSPASRVWRVCSITSRAVRVACLMRRMPATAPACNGVHQRDGTMGQEGEVASGRRGGSAPDGQASGPCMASRHVIRSTSSTGKLPCCWQAGA